MVSSNGTNTDLGDGLGLEQAAGRAPDNHDHCEMPAVKLGQGSYERAWPDDGTVGPLPTSNVRPLSEPEQKQLDEIADTFGIGEHPGQDTQVACRLALDLLTRERRILVASNTLGGVDDVSKVTDADVKEEISEFDHAIEALNAVVCIKPPEGKGAPAAPSPVFQTWDGKTVHYGSVICPVTAPDSQWIAGAEDDEEFTGCIWLQHLHTDARMRLSREACGKCWELAVHRASATAPTKDPADLAQVIFNALDERTISREKVRGLVCQLLLLAR